MPSALCICERGALTAFRPFAKASGRAEPSTGGVSVSLKGVRLVPYCLKSGWLRLRLNARDRGS